MKPYLLVSLVAAAAALLFGCHGSEETTTNNPPQLSATEQMQQQLISLRYVNDSLRGRVAVLEQNARSATAHVAELEMQLNELKEKSAPPPPQQHSKPSINNAREGYGHALNLFKQGNYLEALQTFQAVLDAGAPSGLEDNCYYWMGECSYGAKKYTEAIGYFEKVFTFAVSEKKDDAQMMLGNCYTAMGDKAKAKTAYQQLIKKFPASPFIKRAKEKLASL